MEKNAALQILVELTNNSLGFVPTTPSEFTELCRQIEYKTGRAISLATVKRIWGYVRYECFPSVATLNNLARYNGYKDWQTFMQADMDDGMFESTYVDNSVISTDELNVGDRLYLTWGGGKACEIEYLGEMRFRVNESRNIKLEPGDIFTLHTLSLGHPVYVSDIQRGERSLPAYIGAKKGGLTSITFRSGQ